MRTIVILWISIILPLGLFSQNLKKGFNYLEEGKWTDAGIIFNQSKSDPATKSAAFYGLAKIESTPKRTGFDLFKAYEYITRSVNTLNTMDPKVMNKVSSSFNAEKAKKEKTLIDDALFADVKKKENLDLINRFLKECEDSDHFLEALDLKATFEYKVVLEYDTEKDYLEFIEKYPESKEVDDAKMRIDGLAWKTAQSTNSIESYTIFISTYPKAAQLDTAQALLMEMEYQKAILVNTDYGFLKFIEKYPNTEKSRVLEEKREQLAYDKAISFGAFVVYQSFIEEFPQSKHTPEIVTYRDSLAFMEARKLSTDKGYVDFVNKYPNAKQVPLAMDLLGDMSFSQAELAYMKKTNAIKEQRLKSYKAFRISETDSAQIIVEEQVIYDTLGQELSVMNQPGKAVKTLTSYTYDSKGEQVLNLSILVNDVEEKTTAYTYFKEGLIKSATTNCTSNCKLYPSKYVSIYVYDTLRNMVSKMDSSLVDSTIIARHQYQYNAQGLLVLEDINYWDTTNTSTTYKYDGSKRLVEKSTTNQDGKIQEIISLNYDQRGRKTSKKVFNLVGVVDHTYTYNNQGLIEMEDIGVKNSDDKIRLSYQYEFYER